MLKADILVLNYEGEDLLKRFLPSVVEAAKNSRYDCRVIVLDNQSTDGSEGFVKSAFNEVAFIKAKENKVYCSFNEAVKGLDSDIVILLNNDMRLERNFVDPLIKPFLSAEDVFFVATEGDRSVVTRKWGIISADISYRRISDSRKTSGYTFSAGVGAFDRKKFLELGGYDELYLPGIYEDVDLCFRGWKRGWKGIYAPESRKYHVGGASFKERFREKQISKMVFRNSILFTLKNVTDPLMLAQALSLTSLRTFIYLLTGRWHMVHGFFMAVGKSGEALERRKYVRRDFRLTDVQVIKTVNGDILRTPRTPKAHVIRWAKCAISNLGDAEDVVINIAMALLFPFGMLLFPLEYLLIRELLRCRSVLDLGCGRHSMVGILPKERYRTVGVELFEPYLEQAVKSARHFEYIRADMRKIEFKDKSFDAVVLLDVLEHLKKEEGLALLEKARRWARKKVIINTPNGYYEQAAYDGNDLQEHISGWEVGEFRVRGFSVKGLRGFNFTHIILKRLSLPSALKEFCVRIFNIFNFFVYFFPAAAHQLFCVKDMKNETGE